MEERSSSVANCFLCGDTLGRRSLSHQQRINSRSKSHNDVIMNMWEERCVMSLCQVLRISPGHPAFNALLTTQNNKRNCASCEQLIRNLDFSLQTISNLQAQILSSRKQIFKNILSKSSNPNNNNIKSERQTERNSPNYFPANDEEFILLLDKVLEEQSAWTKVDFLSKVPSDENTSSFRDFVSTEESQSEDIEIKEEVVSPEDEVPEFIIPEEPPLSPEWPSDTADPLELPLNLVQSCYGEETSHSSEMGPTQDSDMEDPLSNDDPDWTMGAGEGSNEDFEFHRPRPQRKTKSSAVVSTSGEHDSEFSLIVHKKKKVSSDMPSDAVPEYRNTGQKLQGMIKRHVQRNSEKNKKSLRTQKIIIPKRNKKMINLAVSQLQKNIESKLTQANPVVNEHLERRQKVFNCKECGKIFKESKALKKHQIVHRVSQSQSNVEDKLGQVIPIVIKNQERKKKVPKCDDCGKIFKESGALKKHEIVHIRQGRLKSHRSCSFCGIWLPNEEIESHESQHRKKEQPFSCLLCQDKEIKFLGIHPLKVHMKEVHPEEFGSIKNLHMYKCKHCSQEFLLRKARNVHLKEVHGDLSKQHLCDVCGKVFSEQYLVALHKTNIHTPKTDKTPSICEVCGKSFSSLDYLNYHKQVHADELKFKCTFCDKAFKFNKALKKHQQIHAGLEFECPDCPKVFTTQRYLQQHSRVHLPVEQRKYYYKTK